jgi:hypothetical protein
MVSLKTPAAALVLFVLLVAGGTAAMAADILAVRPVMVDVTASTASQARDQALAQGQRQAFRRLLESMTLRTDHGRLPNPQQIQDFIVDFSVDQEKSSQVRYIASLTVRFKAESIRNLLRQAGLSFAETVAKPTLILPVQTGMQSGESKLWDDSNVWLKTWSERQPAFSMSPVQAPIGDSGDMNLIDAARALSYDENRINAMIQRYGASSAVVAELQPSANPKSPGVDIKILRSALSPPEILSLSPLPREDITQFYRRAAEAVAQSIEEAWKRDNLLAPEVSGAGAGERSGRLVVQVPFSSLNEWIALRDKLGRIPLVRRHDVMAMSRSGAQVALFFAGDRQQLALALAQQDLSLTPAGEGWTLASSAGKPGGRP